MKKLTIFLFMIACLSIVLVATEYTNPVFGKTPLTTSAYISGDSLHSTRITILKGQTIIDSLTASVISGDLTGNPFTGVGVDSMITAQAGSLIILHKFGGVDTIADFR